MRIFAVSRSQDKAPFVLLDAVDAARAIQTIKDFDAMGELDAAGYWGSEDVNGYRAEFATSQQVADWTANNVAHLARGGVTIAGKKPGDVDRRADTTSYVMLLGRPDFPPS